MKKGKIVAIGGGSGDDRDLFPIFAKIVELTGKKHPDMIFLPTGHFDLFDSGSSALYTEFLRLGCRLELLFVTNPATTRGEIEQKLSNADIIYACGGNLKFIMDSWNRTGASGAIRDAYGRGAVLAGTSSGSMCWFSRGWDDCGENGAFEFIEGLGFLPYCNCPHFETERWCDFTESVKGQSLSGIAAENSAALFYDGEKCCCLKGLDSGHVYYFDAQNGYSETDVTGESWLLNERP